MSGPSDICMMYSVTDVQGINRISEQVLANAAHALAGMMAHARSAAPARSSPPSASPCSASPRPACRRCRRRSRNGYDCLVFHATGTGGQSMEKLADSGLLAGVIDVTTTEVCDHLFGGVFSAGQERLDAIIRSPHPLCRLGRRARHGQFRADGHRAGGNTRTRKLYIHNPHVTLMRTTVAENERHGPLDRREAQPHGGAGALPDPGARRVAARRAGQAVPRSRGGCGLVQGAHGATVRQNERRKIIRLPYNLNDPAFAAALVEDLP